MIIRKQNRQKSCLQKADNDAIGDVQGKVLKAADCIIAIMQAVGEHVRDKHGDKAVVEMLQRITLKALGLIYSDDQEE